jgi:hypothetical protein
VIMKWVKKIVLFAGSLLLLAVIMLSIYASVRQEKITTALIRKVNESINTRISYGNLRVTIFESFPNITVRLSNLLVEPSPFYDKTQFRGENTDTLLYASSLSITVSLPSMLTGTVAVRSITARDGEVNLLTDRRGDINFEVFRESKGDGKNVSLKNISTVNIKTVWHDRSSGMRISGNIGQANVGGEIFRTGIYLNTSVTAAIDSVNLDNLTFRAIPVSAEVKLRKSASSLSVTKGSLQMADLKFDIDGNINYSSSTLNLTIAGKKINIASVLSLLPEKWRSVMGNFSPTGITDIRCGITGPYGDAGKPHIDLTYDLSGGKVSNLASGFRVNNLEFSGGITNGDLNSAETFHCTVDNLNATYGSASIKGSFMLNNLTRPHITLALDGDIDFDDLGRVMTPGYIHDQTGSVTGSIRISGTLPDSMRFASALPLLKPDISLIFSGFGVAGNRNGFALSDMNGSLKINNDLVADSLSFTFREQHFTMNTVMKNFIPWVAGRPVILEITGDVAADRFVTSVFAGKQSDTLQEGRRPLNIFPSDVRANVRIRTDSLIFNDFRASEFNSTLEYKPYVITFRNITATGLDGFLTGEFMLGKQKEGGYITRSKLAVTGIDINKAFIAFNNFGQDFIRSENLHGNLTGNMTLLSPLDDSYKINRKEMVAEAHLIINDGKLVGFAPAESLSSYLDLDELKDISFSRMENDLFIKGETVSVPKMLINSTAVNFTVYVTHSLGGDYSYHVRLLLSEVLSRKARDRNRGVSSFGQVQVDGSGKTTVPLKIVCVNEQIDVGYDFGQAQDNIKTDIAIEKQSLKGILNEEYGWYKADTTRVTPSESKPKFSVTWEEGKEQVPAPEKNKEEVKESPFRIILKKKNSP